MTDDLLYVREDAVLVEHAGQDDEKGMRLGEGQPYQCAYSKVGDLYRACLKQHGRCVGYMLVGEGKASHRIGWVFRRRPTRVEVWGRGGMLPVPKHTLLETWVEVFTSPPQLRWTAGKHAKVG